MKFIQPIYARSCFWQRDTRQWTGEPRRRMESANALTQTMVRDQEQDGIVFLGPESSVVRHRDVSVESGTRKTTSLTDGATLLTSNPGSHSQMHPMLFMNPGRRRFAHSPILWKKRTTS